MTRQTASTIVLDVTGVPFGRACSKIAHLLQGKANPAWSPEKIGSVTVVVQNVSKLRFTGNKLLSKQYHRYSGYPGGVKTVSLADRFARDPEGLVRHGVERMLPNNKLRSPRLKLLRFA